MNIGIVICSRLKSTRLPNKAHLLLENKTVISHLVNNLLDLNTPIVVTVPAEDFQKYITDESIPTKSQKILIHKSEYSEDPLARTTQVAKQFGFDAVIRITHDKIFIDTDALRESIKAFKSEKADYLYSSNLIPGTNFEIISYRCLFEASQKYKNVEHISYAVRTTSLKTINYNYTQNNQGLKGLSLLLDYEDDYKLFQVIYSVLGPNARLRSVLDFIRVSPHLIRINKKPLISIYTCAYNSSEFINTAIESVMDQSIINDCEYILIDDCSNDHTFEIMAAHGIFSNKISYFRNTRNLGLSSSCNIALNKARGNYILRLDSDDYFMNYNIIQEMLEHIQINNFEALYPDNYFGDISVIQKGKEKHHVGGTLFNKNALNFIKFTDGLRGYEGYDLFLRARDRLKIGYFEKPAFYYTQRENSLSKSNNKFRNKIKTEIDIRLGVGNEKK
jgi:spore coat polysaccharide biosynthesis protein SpsF (cytidylyltransferase family)